MCQLGLLGDQGVLLVASLLQFPADRFVLSGELTASRWPITTTQLLLRLAQVVAAGQLANDGTGQIAVVLRPD